MSIDKSLKSKSRLNKIRSVLTRAERIEKLKEDDKWVEGSSVVGLAKTRVVRAVLGKKKKEKKEVEDPKAKGKKGAAAKGAAAKSATPAPAAKAAAPKKK